MHVLPGVTDKSVFKCLRTGGIGILPTDTVYGLVGLANNPRVLQRIFEVKHREHTPGTIIAASVDQLVELGLHRRYLTAVEQYWPGALSVIVPCGMALEYLHMGKHSIAVRIPDAPELCALLMRTGPLMTTSANEPGQPTATTIAGAQAYFGDRVDFYVDGGDLSGRPPSTIIRIVDDAIEIIRGGAVHINQNGRVKP